jgi:hypothetical protein
MAGVPMRLSRITLLLALCLMLVSCGGGGSSGSPGTINGNWSATLTGTGTSPSVPVTIQFAVTLNQTNPPAVDVKNFIQNSTSCLSTSNTLSSTFSNGAFTLHVAAFSGAFQNVLDLQGNLNGQTITGNWTFTGGPVTRAVPPPALSR